MESLETLAGLKPNLICPGHGQIIKNGTARVAGYIRHRTEREDQVLAALESGVESVDDIVTAVYSRNLRRNLRSAAGRNVRTHLDKLTEEGRVERSEARFKMVKG
jgi:glyoxylase-like metal-dependent hydrolase (beta-lactamase superfamily II)